MKDTTLSLDQQLLCRAPARQIAAYLQSLLNAHSEKQISQTLLHHIGDEAVPADVSRIWLDIARSASTIVHALQQDRSVRLRCSAISHVGRLLASLKWQHIWDALGAEQGIAGLLSAFSCYEVRLFARTLGRSVRASQPAFTFKRIAITKLFQQLTHLPHSAMYTSGSASISAEIDSFLHRSYLALIPACTSEMVKTLLFQVDSGITLLGNQGHLVREHPDVFLEAFSSLQPPQIINWLDFDVHLPSVISAIHFPTHEGADNKKTKRFVYNILSFVLDKSNPSSCGDIWEAHMEQCSGPKCIQVPLLMQRLFQNRSLDKRTAQQAFEALMELSYNCPQWATVIKQALLREVVKLWFKWPSQFVSALHQLVDSYPRSRSLSLVKWMTGFVPKKARWNLLISINQSPTQDTRGSGEEDALELFLHLNRNVKTWPTDFFLSFDRGPALRILLELAIRMPKDGFLLPVSTPSILGLAGPSGFLNFDMLRLELDTDMSQQDRVETTTAKAQYIRQLCSEDLQLAERKILPLHALMWAVCSRSLDTYEETNNWLLRYIKHDKIARSVFSQDGLQTPEAIKLLSGISYLSHTTTTIESTCDRVRQSNRILWTIFEKLLRSSLDPGPYPYGPPQEPLAVHALGLIRAVVMHRMQRVEHVQTHFRLDTRGIFSLMWDDTVRLLIRIEDLCMQQPFRDLSLSKYFYHLNGPLAFEVSFDLLESPGVEVKTMAGFAFVEAYFEARDALWTRHRCAQYPAVSRFPQGLPQGLPLQTAFGIWNTNSILPRVSGSILLTRASSIVFADADTVGQPMLRDPDDLKAVNECVEDWTFALLLLTKAKDTDYGKMGVLQQAWRYAITTLSEQRMSLKDAEGFWRDNVFAHLRLDNFPDYRAIIQSGPFPQLPVLESTKESDPVEWNPDPSRAEQKKPPKVLEPTILDAMIDQQVVTNLYEGTLLPVYGSFNESRFQWRMLPVQESQPSMLQIGPSLSPWLLDPPSRSSTILKNILKARYAMVPPEEHRREVREAMVAVYLLLLKEKCSPNTDPLFADTARYPNLKISADFLAFWEQLYPKRGEVTALLIAFKAYVPPKLLRRLLEQVLEAQREGTLPQQSSHLTINLLRCLQLSDRPSEALTMLLALGTSGALPVQWHPVLSSPPFWKRLPAHQLASAYSSLTGTTLSHKYSSMEEAAQVKPR